MSPGDLLDQKTQSRRKDVQRMTYTADCFHLTGVVVETYESLSKMLIGKTSSEKACSETSAHSMGVVDAKTEPGSSRAIWETRHNNHYDENP